MTKVKGEKDGKKKSEHQIFGFFQGTDFLSHKHF